MMSFKNFIKEWMLPIAMVTGASVYLVYHWMPEPVHRIGPFLESTLTIVQPLLIFLMLFLTFCRIEPRELKPHRWHWWLLLVQGGFFTVSGLVAAAILKWTGTGHGDWVVLVESAMLCLICPTATAAAVVTRKLGGDVPGITTYVILINILTALLIPLIVPLIQPYSGMEFWTAFSMILAKVLPLLIMPCLAAWLVRYLAPRLHRRLMRYPDLPFYIWALALTFAIAVSMRHVMHTSLSGWMLVAMAGISLLCCAFQFSVGRSIGGTYDHKAAIRRGMSLQNDTKVTSGQALGQKNTVFIIWVAYTFMTPETAMIGGLYSIWHNVYNSWQLRRAGKVR